MKPSSYFCARLIAGVLMLFLTASAQLCKAQVADTLETESVEEEPIDDEMATTPPEVTTERGTQLGFRIFPTEETARAYYLALLTQGYDLEADRFLQRNRNYTYSLTLARRGSEAFFAEVGARISGNGNAGTVANYTLGASHRLTAATRFWHSISYLQQDKNLGHYKQGEYFATLQTFVGNGWYLKPALHFVYTPFTDEQSRSYPVSYIDSFKARTRYIIYKTNATQRLDYTGVGRSYYMHVGLPIAKRMLKWTFELQPSLQYIRTRASRTSTFTNNGTTDSLRTSGTFLGSKPYTETGTEQLPDTAITRFIGQIGGSVIHNLMVRKIPLLIRVSGWYLLSNVDADAYAYQAYALLQATPKLWLHLSYLNKGRLPLALEQEGIYLNLFHAINARAGITAQFVPLKRWSPMITYQFERQTRFTDDAELLYHAVYFTLKYRL